MGTTSRLMLRPKYAALRCRGFIWDLFRSNETTLIVYSLAWRDPTSCGLYNDALLAPAWQRLTTPQMQVDALILPVGYPWPVYNMGVLFQP